MSDALRATYRPISEYKMQEEPKGHKYGGRHRWLRLCRDFQQSPRTLFQSSYFTFCQDHVFSNSRISGSCYFLSSKYVTRLWLTDDPRINEWKFMDSFLIEI